MVNITKILLAYCLVYIYLVIMIGLTEKQKDLLKAVYSFREKNGYPPTLEELSKELNKTRKAIADQLKLIEKKGYIKIIPRTARGIIIYESKIKEII